VPFIGFLGPTWEQDILTRILRRQGVFYHILFVYTSIIFKNIVIFHVIFIVFARNIQSRQPQPPGLYIIRLYLGLHRAPVLSRRYGVPYPDHRSGVRPDFGRISPCG